LTNSDKVKTICPPITLRLIAITDKGPLVKDERGNRYVWSPALHHFVAT